MPRHIAILLLALLVAGLSVLSSHVIAEGSVRYAEARVLDASPGYIVNFTGSYPGDNTIIEYYNGTMHKLEIVRETVIKEFGAGDVFTYTVTDNPNTDAYRLRIHVGENTYLFYIYVYGHEYTGTMGENVTVAIYFDYGGSPMKIMYNGTEIYSKTTSSGEDIVVEFKGYGIYVDGEKISGDKYFSYIWRIEKTYSGQPPTGPWKFIFSRVNNSPEVYIDGNKISTLPTSSIYITYNGTHIALSSQSTTYINTYTGTISYVNSTSILRIYYYMEPETITQTITSTVTQTVTETETTTETVTHTINNTLTLTNTVTSVETLTVNNTITKYVPYYSGYNSYLLVGGLVVVIVLVLLFLVGGRGRR